MNKKQKDYVCQRIRQKFRDATHNLKPGAVPTEGDSIRAAILSGKAKLRPASEVCKFLIGRIESNAFRCGDLHYTQIFALPASHAAAVKKHATLVAESARAVKFAEVAIEKLVDNVNLDVYETGQAAIGEADRIINQIKGGK